MWFGDPAFVHAKLVLAEAVGLAMCVDMIVMIADSVDESDGPSKLVVP